MPGMKGTMDEYKHGELHSGSKSGPVVKNRKQAIAIGLSEERKMGHKVPKPHEAHKAPKHPHAHTTHHEGHMPHADHHESNHGHPGHHLRMKEDGHTVGHSYGPHSDPNHESASSGRVLVAGHPGHHMSMGAKPHGFGHAAHQHHGKLRSSGHPHAHRIGHRKK